MNTQELAANLHETGGRFIDHLSGFSEAEMNKVPFENSWTAAQVAEHIVKASDAGVLFMPGAPAERDPAKNVQSLRDIFLNFDAKYKSAPNLLPEEKHYEKTPLIHTLQQQWSQLEEAARTQDLSELIDAFEFPGMGKLTKFEALNLVVVHTQRHLQQLDHIRHMVTA
jgi:uncharacterized damage-inducible protein DinB